ncbi:hypothetical protein FQR65_LT01984 [Abscondita terminalis]|nr:hypothetical protein FQR65_LT01984 [Abscondita terminalis]
MKRGFLPKVSTSFKEYAAPKFSTILLHVTRLDLQSKKNVLVWMTQHQVVQVL